MHPRCISARQACFLFLVVVLAATCLVSQAPTEERLSATYSHGVVHAIIPYQAPYAGRGKLTVEILDPEDHAIGYAERTADAGAKGVWREDIALTKPMPVEELVWHRLRYRFSYTGSQDAIAEDTESISQILRMPVLRIIGQQSYLDGRQCGGARDRHGFQERADRRAWPGADRTCRPGRQAARVVRRSAEPAWHDRGAVPISRQD